MLNYFVYQSTKDKDTINNFIWTTGSPIKDGIYQAVLGGDVVMAEVAGDIVWLLGDDMPYELSDFTHWLGPIQLAEKPE